MATASSQVPKYKTSASSLTSLFKHRT